MLIAISTRDQLHNNLSLLGTRLSHGFFSWSSQLKVCSTCYAHTVQRRVMRNTVQHRILGSKSCKVSFFFYSPFSLYRISDSRLILATKPYQKIPDVPLPLLLIPGIITNEKPAIRNDSLLQPVSDPNFREQRLLSLFPSPGIDLAGAGSESPERQVSGV